MAIVKPGRPGASARARRAKPASKRRRWKLYLFATLAVPLLVLSAVTSYYYVVFSKMIDARLHGEMQRTDPRVFARPFELRRGQSLTPVQLVDRLNDLGYSHRARSEQPGEFTVGRDAVVVIPRDGDHKAQPVRIVFVARGAKGAEPAAIDRIEEIDARTIADRLTLDPPLITALITSGREKRRDVPLAAIPPAHGARRCCRSRTGASTSIPAIDPIGIGSAVFGYLFGNKSLRGGSTITQQLVKNTFLTPGADAQAQADRVDHVGRARTAALEEPGPRAVPERRLARPARVVRHPRRPRSRRGSSSPRTSRTSR